tara:strand:- start:46375 stop:46653 length:279 start_codon:yes stop_codon:yes gene_type:complete
MPIKAKVNKIIQDSTYKDDFSPIIIPNKIFDALVSTGMINGKNISGNKKLFEVLVLVNKKINIPNDINPKFEIKFNKIKFVKRVKFKSENTI